MSPRRTLRNLLDAPCTSYLLEAHDACSALIAQEAGFPGIWASSLTLSCAAGLCDDSELSLEPVLYTLESMVNRLDIPVLFDGDTGYGGFNQFRQLVRRLERRGVSGVCIEDKLFPKSNSFVASADQHLCPVDEFVGKLRAGLDTRSGAEFVIIARTEALVTGAGMEEALRRAHAFVDAGADAVLVHSKATTFAEVRAFCARWDRSTPIVCVPTCYPGTPRSELEASGVRVAIWANHLLRASVRAMQTFAARLREHETPVPEAEHLTPLAEIFRLQGVPELEASRRRYDARPTRRVALYHAGAGGSAGLSTQLRSLGWRAIDALDGSLLALHDWLACQGDAASDLLVLPGDLRLSDRALDALDSTRVELAVLVEPGRAAGHGEVGCTWEPAEDEPEAPLLLAGAVAGPGGMGVWTGALRLRGPGVTRMAKAMARALATHRTDLAAVLREAGNLGAVYMLPIWGGWSREGAAQDAPSLATASM